MLHNMIDFQPWVHSFCQLTMVNAPLILWVVCVSVCVCVCVTRVIYQLNIKKTKVLFQPAPGAPEMADPVIRVHDDPLECVTSFHYLGSHLASNT